MSTVQPLQELSEPVNQFPDTYAVFLPGGEVYRRKALASRYMPPTELSAPSVQALTPSRST